VDDDEVALGHGVVDLEGQLGERRAQPERRGVEPGGAGNAAIERFVPGLSVDGERVDDTRAD
jgi:hypothetical protein